MYARPRGSSSASKMNLIELVARIGSQADPTNPSTIAPNLAASLSRTVLHLPAAVGHTFER
jgi:hypothetical protein